MGSTLLGHRGVLEVSGPEARAFLDRIVTCDVDQIAPGRARYGALLSPQGKILADFILFAKSDDVFLLDTPSAAMGDLAKRLTLYRLRAKIAITERDDLAAVAGWDDARPPGAVVAAAPDPRLSALGWRAVVPSNSHAEVLATGEPRITHDKDAGNLPSRRVREDGGYEGHRIRLGVPEGGRDFAFANAFPHEALMDQLAGVAFDKGCYVGQEVVSRMQHRGTARTRIVPVRYEGEAPPPGTEVLAGDRSLGRSGTGQGTAGLATLRLDRAADALAAGKRLTAAGLALAIEPRDWIRFPLPGTASDNTAA